MGILYQNPWSRAILALLGLFWLGYAFRPQVTLLLQLVTGGWATAFLALPLAKRLETRFRRPMAATLSVGSLACLVLLLVFLLVPPVLFQLLDLAKRAPEGLSIVRRFAKLFIDRLAEQGLDVANWLQGLDAGPWTQNLGGVLTGATQFAGSVADTCFRCTMSVLLGLYFLTDRERLALQTELLVPKRFRKLAVCLCFTIARELRAYLVGQLAVSAVVALLTTGGLMLLRVRSSLALGMIVGVFNIIPYFGPILGGAPVVLAALTQGLLPALLSIALLFLVQQIDGLVISPRIMSGVTGLSPAAVLLALTLGGNLGGALGMLLSLPVLLIVRICYRIWASRKETIENHDEM